MKHNMKTENAYDFRKKLLEVHEKNIRDFDIKPAENEFVINDGIKIEIPENEPIAIFTGNFANSKKLDITTLLIVLESKLILTELASIKDTLSFLSLTTFIKSP